MGYNDNFRRPQQGGGYSAPAPASKPIVAKKLPDDFVDQAEKVILRLIEINEKDSKKRPITSTKIRKLFSLFTDIYNNIIRDDSNELSVEHQHGLTSARIRLVYECGRDKSNMDVFNFVQEAEILDYLKGIGTSKKEFLRFHQYFESLIAYHRYYIGEEKNKQ